MEQKSFSLPIVSSSEAVSKALREIEESRNVEQAGLLSRWDKLNHAFLGSIRFGHQIALCGMSGSGKSFFLNMLRKDFANKQLQAKFKKKYRQVHFAFEMSSTDELIRSASSETKQSYADIISAYHRLPDDKFFQVKAFLETMRDSNVDYVEVTGNVQQIYNTIISYQNNYPDERLVISIDHTLLTDYLHEKDEISLVSNLSKMMVGVRKQMDSLNILVCQLNTDIEDKERIMNPALHYPIKKDIHGSKSVYQAADYVLVIHSPEKLGIAYYGPKKHPTEGMIFNHIIKVRKGEPCVIKYKENFKEGNLIEL